MLKAHFDRLRPLCPTCRTTGRGAQPLRIGDIARSEGEDILEGVLLCTERQCQREHPVIDGIPVVVSDAASWASHQLDGVLRRDDLTPFVESVLGDAAGPQSNFERDRANLSIYGWAHWGDALPPSARAQGGSFAALLEQAYALLPGPPAGPWVDLGCSVGRGTLELASRGCEMAVGVDLNFSMLRVAERVRRSGRARFPLRRVGLVYDRCDAAVAHVPRDRMSFWCCDVSVLPFADSAFSGALTLNLIDCVPSPLAHLVELGRVLASGAPALYSSPYDWSQNAAEPGQWLGGHSQRSASGGDSPAELRRILSPECAAGIDSGLLIDEERDGVSWALQTSERSTVRYATHLARLRRKD